MSSPEDKAAQLARSLFFNLKNWFEPTALTAFLDQRIRDYCIGIDRPALKASGNSRNPSAIRKQRL
jgi:hypothetical protein